jgi:hypothetical protein
MYNAVHRGIRKIDLILINSETTKLQTVKIQETILYISSYQEQSNHHYKLTQARYNNADDI